MDKSINVFQNMEIKMNNLLSHMLIMSRMEKLHGTQSQLYYSTFTGVYLSGIIKSPNYLFHNI